MTMYHIPKFTFTEKGLFPVGSVVIARKDLTGFHAEVYNECVGSQYIVEKYNQYGTMYLLNLDGTSMEWQLGGGSKAECFEPVFTWEVFAGYPTWYTKQVPKIVDLTQFKQTTSGDTNMTTKQFTKKDLKTGYRLILEDGEVGIVFMDSEIISINYSRNWVKYINHSNGFDDLAYWNDDLTPPEDFGVSKVIRVEKPSHASDIFKLDCDIKVIWEREAPKSKEQIAYDEAVEATEAARQAYELAQKKLEALNPSGFHPANEA